MGLGGVLPATPSTVRLFVHIQCPSYQAPSFAWREVKISKVKRSYFRAQWRTQNDDVNYIQRALVLRSWKLRIKKKSNTDKR